jgi:hypothetical protein
MKKIAFWLGILAAIGLGARYEFDLESGSAFVRYSDIQIPKSTGTRISFSEELKSNPAWFIRGRFTCYFNARNSLSALVAPLEFRGSGRVNREVVFEGVAFPANAILSTVYKFNSYRLSYQHYWPVGTKLKLGLGVTAKIREAAISIADSVRSSEKTNIGFVPIVRFSLWWRFARPFALLLEGDALAAPQGRAEDVSITLIGSITRGLSFKAGYRVLEGGSDVEPVYSFTWVNYLLAGLVASF